MITTRAPDGANKVKWFFYPVKHQIFDDTPGQTFYMTWDCVIRNYAGNWSEAAFPSPSYPHPFHPSAIPPAKVWWRALFHQSVSSPVTRSLSSPINTDWSTPCALFLVCAPCRFIVTDPRARVRDDRHSALLITTAPSRTWQYKGHRYVVVHITASQGKH